MKLRHWLCWAAGWLADWRVCKRVFHPGDYLPLPLLLDNAFVRFWNFTCWDGTKQTYVVSVAYSEWRSPLSIVNVAGKKNTELRCCIFFLYFYYLSFRIGAAHEAVIEQTQRTQKQKNWKKDLPVCFTFSLQLDETSCWSSNIDQEDSEDYTERTWKVEIQQKKSKN